MTSRLLLSVLTVLALPLFSQADERRIHVFVALCDNATQGIVKVNARIGNGDDPPHNLYWGCSDGLSSYFKKSSKWKLIKTEKAVSEKILERLTFQHANMANVTLVAEAYRGSEMKSCLIDFFKAAGDAKDTKTKMVAFIGHNGLMDHPGLQIPEGNGKRDAIVLGCVSNAYFSGKLKKMSVRPVLMTKSLMYPGAFILHDALEGWLRGESKAQLRERAAKAYARNQKISVSGGRSVFSDLKQEE